MEDAADESGTAAKEEELKRKQDEIEQLAETLRVTLNGKASAETRMEQLIEELEDKTETIEHLQVLEGFAWQAGPIELLFRMGFTCVWRRLMSEYLGECACARSCVRGKLTSGAWGRLCGPVESAGGD